MLHMADLMAVAENWASQAQLGMLLLLVKSGRPDAKLWQ